MTSKGALLVKRLVPCVSTTSAFQQGLKVAVTNLTASLGGWCKPCCKLKSEPYE